MLGWVKQKYKFANLGGVLTAKPYIYQGLAKKYQEYYEYEN